LAPQDLDTNSESPVTGLASDHGSSSIFLASFGDGSVKIFDRRMEEDDAVVRAYRGHTSWVQNVKWHPFYGGQFFSARRVARVDASEEAHAPLVLTARSSCGTFAGTTAHSTSGTCATRVCPRWTCTLRAACLARELPVRGVAMVCADARDIVRRRSTARTGASSGSSSVTSTARSRSRRSTWGPGSWRHPSSLGRRRSPPVPHHSSFTRWRCSTHSVSLTGLVSSFDVSRDQRPTDDLTAVRIFGCDLSPSPDSDVEEDEDSDEGDDSS
jgi:hypothetical protein